jgi:hypothetical protein
MERVLTALDRRGICLTPLVRQKLMARGEAMERDELVTFVLTAEFGDTAYLDKNLVDMVRDALIEALGR